MGPRALYDKSFLEGLNVDEAVMFDYFFYPVTCPVFFVETLADLDKEMKRGRTAEEVVGSIALKTPQMHGGPNVYHRSIVISNLMGNHVPMTGQIVIAGGRPVHVKGKNSVVIENTPEAEAFDRWQRGAFLDVERGFAQRWRAEMKQLDLSVFAARAQTYGFDISACKNLRHARSLAQAIIEQLDPKQQLQFAADRLSLYDAELKRGIMDAWGRTGGHALAVYAPYASFVLIIELFFEIALARGMISVDRTSNFNDLAYLYYLPFCDTFISSDRLHRECAPLFLRSDQEFSWGQDVKRGLRENHEALMKLPDEVRNRGLLSMSPAPQPGIIADIYARLAHSPAPKPNPSRPDAPNNAPSLDSLADMVKEISDAPSVDQSAFFPSDKADSMVIQRQVSRRRGSWFQVPHDLKRDAP